MPPKLTREELVHLLAKKAKELTNGMQDRVGRNPDVADYVAGFTRAIMEAETPKQTEQETLGDA